MLLLSTAAFMLLQIWLAQVIVNLRSSPAVAGLMAALFTLLWFGGVVALHPSFERSLLLGLTITLGCSCLGILLAQIIREPNMLLPVALVAMPIDYLGAMTQIGFTQNAVAQNPKLVQSLSVPVPSLGGGLHPLGYIGPGDALFLAFFFAVVQRLQMNGRGTFWLMYGLLTATMLIVLVTGVNIAALIPMGLTVLIANRAYFRLKREELFATLYAGTLVLVLVTGFYLYSHTHFYHADPQGDIHAPLSPTTRPAPSRPAGNG